MLILLDINPTIHELCHWLKYVGVCISIAKFDVNYGAILSVP